MEKQMKTFFEKNQGLDLPGPLSSLPFLLFFASVLVQHSGNIGNIEISN
jgi:hypothetical protein